MGGPPQVRPRMPHLRTLPATFVIGRGAPDCDVHIDDPYVSARHAQVTVTHDWVATIADLGSTNGTRIRRGATTFEISGPTVLEVGDIIIVGHTHIPWRNSGT